MVVSTHDSRLTTTFPIPARLDQTNPRTADGRHGSVVVVHVHSNCIKRTRERTNPKRKRQTRESESTKERMKREKIREREENIKRIEQRTENENGE